ncbi:hypothetical protein Lesp02_37200 [Lentzea sp. NBRC 105346]|uniref:DUF4232 domain-containing protein n=1 Tax=Lentzea sp. NBRC 105346 TaxID=3032205 RepID=UPI0024A30011|nr:DUF4232 domain-containing protein [Lentzea sp. NBRC 105346]GLZ31532.1 hypothetical protein Lesp02_37200 [Lentzea sp. NBRC 105346]
MRAIALLLLPLAACSAGVQSAPPAGTEQGVKPATTEGACAADVFTAEVRTQPDVGKAIVSLTNHGSKSCPLKGNPEITFTLSDGRPVNVPVEKVPQPGRGADFTVQPGETAYAGLKWTACEGADCQKVEGIRVGLPVGGTLVARWFGSDGAQQMAAVPVKTAQVGTLQQAAQGVIAW